MSSPDSRPADLSDLFSTPKWLRDLGTSAWLAVGIAVLIVAVISVLSLTRTIVMPVITASVVAAVASPLVARLARHRIPRLAGAILVLLMLVVVGAALTVMVIGAITDQADALRSVLASAKDTIAEWMNDLGIGQGTTDAAKEDASTAANDIVPALLNGIGGALERLSSLLFFLALTILSLLFLLADGPRIRQWAEGHLSLPRPIAHQVGERVLQSLRGYFVGVTVVALFNAGVVALGAFLLGVPLPGSIAAVTFVGAYIPYLGAWSAGVFSVVVALGGAGTDAALGMIVVQLLANGILQQMVQPIAMGASLGIHPLAVLIVTIGGGALFGAAGLILGAPLTAAAVRVGEDIRAQRRVQEEAAAPAGPG
jgi:putative heme transporter